MGRRKPPVPHRDVGGLRRPIGVIALERFSAASLARWAELSSDLDELNASLFFGTRPEQRRLRPALIESLQAEEPCCLKEEGWVRMLTYQFSLKPLSAGGSLLSYGGRFNAGADLDAGTLDPWPCLYIAEDDETAFREKFQMASTVTANGLTPEELALVRSQSYTKVAVNVELHRIFDLSNASTLQGVARVLGRIKMPARAKDLKKKLRIPNGDLKMVSTGPMLFDLLHSNWRTLPVQFGLPAPSQVFAELVRAAGYEAILYRSTKSTGRCLAVFPDLLGVGSSVELAGAAPPEVRLTRLDSQSATALSGWEDVPIRTRGGFGQP